MTDSKVNDIDMSEREIVVDLLQIERYAFWYGKCGRHRIGRNLGVEMCDTIGRRLLLGTRPQLTTVISKAKHIDIIITCGCCIDQQLYIPQM